MKNKFTIEFELDFEPKFESDDLSDTEKDLANYYLRNYCINMLIDKHELFKTNYVQTSDKDLGELSAVYKISPIRINYESILF
jgi:hypothetical protein